MYISTILNGHLQAKLHLTEEKREKSKNKVCKNILTLQILL